MRAAATSRLPPGGGPRTFRPPSCPRVGVPCGARLDPSTVRDRSPVAASFSRLIVFDKRGTGMSDRVSGVPTLETRMNDLRAVMDAAGSAARRSLGLSEGAPMACFSRPRIRNAHALILVGDFARSRGRPTIRGARRRSRSGRSAGRSRVSFVPVWRPNGRFNIGNYGGEEVAVPGRLLQAGPRVPQPRLRRCGRWTSEIDAGDTCCPRSK